MTHIGIDACKAGWVVWSWQHDEVELEVVAELSEITEQLRDAHTLIDIPVGFSDSETPDRLCDKAARKYLTRTRGASVFPVPCREAAYAESYPQACEINFELCGRKLSKQAWYILPKVREVDALLNLYPELYLRESHPEVVFATLNGAPLEHSKKSIEGQQQRLDLLARYLPKHIDKLKHQVATTKKSKVAPDDLIDAFALMLCALHSDQLSSFPESEDNDPQGRTREIVYWQPSSD